MNTTYVKQYDKNGELLNPIKGLYKGTRFNRKERRKKLNSDKIKRFQIIPFIDEKLGMLTLKSRCIKHYKD